MVEIDKRLKIFWVLYVALVNVGFTMWVDFDVTVNGVCVCVFELR